MTDDVEDQDKHRARHALLHAHLDELIADFITHTGKRLQTPLIDLMQWSAQQVDAPTPTAGSPSWLSRGLESAQQHGLGDGDDESR